jgi:hypothetical protein
MSGVIAIADVIPDMRALSKLIFNGGVYGRYGDWTERDIATLESSLTGANFSNKRLGVLGAMIISAWLSSGKDKGPLSVLSLKDNSLCDRQAGKALSEILAVNTVLKVLDVSSNRTKFDSSARDGPGYAQELAVGLKGNHVITELNIADCNLSSGGSDMSGVIALANAIPDMGALIKLDISSDYPGYIADAHWEDLQRICAAGSIEFVE